MLDGDVASLAALLHDELAFVGPTGAVVGKEEDLDRYRTARQRIRKLEPRDHVVQLHGDGLGVVTVLVELEGSLNGSKTVCPISRHRHA